MSYNNIIKSDDPQALEKLSAKVAECEKAQEYMKTVNSYYRKNGTAKGCEGVSDKLAEKYDDKVKSGYSWQKSPFPAYAVTNNNAEIRRLKKRIDEISTNKETGFAGWLFSGGEVVANEANGRLQLLFDEKPSDEQRTTLKMNGFRWAPSEGAWQRQLNVNAVHAASKIDFIKPENKPGHIELRPEQHKKEEQER